jgi:hypothetical protein
VTRPTAFRPMPRCHVIDRLILRPWTLADAAEYRALVRERHDGVPTLAEIEKRITAQLAESERTGIGLLAIVRRAEGDFIGYCGLVSGRATVAEPWDHRGALLAPPNAELLETCCVAQPALASAAFASQLGQLGRDRGGVGDGFGQGSCLSVD